MLDEQNILTQEQRDVMPEEVQQLYIEVYRQIWQQYDEKRDGPMSREAVASISAMAAITRQFDRDKVTLRWYRKGEQPIDVQEPHDHSALRMLKGIFRRH